MDLFPDFWLFSQFESRKEGTYCLTLNYFPQCQTRKECFVVFKNLRPETYELISRFITIFLYLRPEIVARKLSAVKLYTFAEIISLRSLRHRTGIEHKPFSFEGTNWKTVEVYSTEWLYVKRSTQLICNDVNSPANRIRRETFLQRLKQRLFQVDFPKNSWLNTCFQLAQYIRNISSESISILI